MEGGEAIQTQLEWHMPPAALIGRHKSLSGLAKERIIQIKRSVVETPPPRSVLWPPFSRTPPH